jgi:hypothetical protein
MVQSTANNTLHHLVSVKIRDGDRSIAQSIVVEKHGGQIRVKNYQNSYCT